MWVGATKYIARYSGRQLEAQAQGNPRGNNNVFTCFCSFSGMLRGDKWILLRPLPCLPLGFHKKRVPTFSLYFFSIYLKFYRIAFLSNDSVMNEDFLFKG